MLRLLTRPLSAGAANGAGLDWRTAEAALYCVRAVHRWAARLRCSTVFSAGKTAVAHASTRCAEVFSICHLHARCVCAMLLLCHTGHHC